MLFPAWVFELILLVQFIATLVLSLTDRITSRSVCHFLYSGVFGTLFYHFYFLAIYNDSPYLINADDYIFFGKIHSSVPIFVLFLWSSVTTCIHAVSNYLILPSSFHLQVLLDGLLTFSFFLSFEYIGSLTSLWHHTSEAQYYLLGAPTFYIFYHFFGGLFFSFFVRLSDLYVGLPDEPSSLIQRLSMVLKESFRIGLCTIVSLTCLFLIILFAGIVSVFTGYNAPQLITFAVFVVLSLVIALFKIPEWGRHHHRTESIWSLIPFFVLVPPQIIALISCFFDNLILLHIVLIIGNSLGTILIVCLPYYKEFSMANTLKYITIKPLLRTKSKQNVVYPETGTEINVTGMVDD
ncbi:hypothetical protein P9112_014107 [Eukaryota sp. TZLM1-RC]